MSHQYSGSAQAGHGFRCLSLPTVLSGGVKQGAICSGCKLWPEIWDKLCFLPKTISARCLSKHYPSHISAPEVISILLQNYTAITFKANVWFYNMCFIED